MLENLITTKVKNLLYKSRKFNFLQDIHLHSIKLFFKFFQLFLQ